MFMQASSVTVIAFQKETAIKDEEIKVLLVSRSETQMACDETEKQLQACRSKLLQLEKEIELESKRHNKSVDDHKERRAQLLKYSLMLFGEQRSM